MSNDRRGKSARDQHVAEVVHVDERVHMWRAAFRRCEGRF